MLSKESKVFSVFNNTVYLPASEFDGSLLLRMICHPDVIETIAAYMHFKDLVSLSCICRMARRIIYNNVRCWRVIDLGYRKGTILERYQNAKATHLATFRTIQLLFRRSNIPFDRLTEILLDFSAIQYPAVRFVILQAGLTRLEKISLRHCRFISLKDLNSILVSLQRVWSGEASYYKQSSLAIAPYTLKELRVRYMKGLPKCTKDLYYNYSQYNLLYTFRNIAKLLRLETDVETCSMIYPNNLWHNREICIDYWNDLDQMDYGVYYPINNIFFDLNKTFRTCGIHPEIANYKFCGICLQSSQCTRCGLGVCPFCQGVDQCNLFYLNVRGQGLSENAPLKVGFCQQCGILCKECRNNTIPNCLVCLVPYCSTHMSSKIKYHCEIGGEGMCNKCDFEKPWLKYCFGGCGRVMCKKEVAGKCFKCQESICWQCMKLSTPLESAFLRISSADHSLAYSSIFGILGDQNTGNMVSGNEMQLMKTICAPCHVLIQLRKRKLKSRKFYTLYGPFVKQFTKYISRKRLALKLYKYATKLRHYMKKHNHFYLNDKSMIKRMHFSLMAHDINPKNISMISSHSMNFINVIKVAINRELENGMNKKELIDIIISIMNNILNE
ncbi:hypothetical protein PCANB_001276 [Pneumocystis canis]|nr:hypothetical protein PCANB_001276 [Pneumocystis canis]